MIRTFKDLQEFFIPPHQTAAGIAFGNPPTAPSFKDAKVVLYGVCFDDTATCGKGSVRGPEGIRHVSARQIEHLVLDEKRDAYKKGVVDLGDFKIKARLTDAEKILLQSEIDSKERRNVVKKVERMMTQFDVLEEVTTFLVSQGKIPLLIGGEHTLSYWPLCALGDQKPVVIHFDAHRDAKDVYMDMKLCHTTPMYYFLRKYPIDFIQIGTRQADQQEEDFAKQMGITTFYPEDVKQRMDDVKKFIQEKTKGRDLYITLDIDVLDICYTPCTGTPEPFGLTPEDIVKLFKSVDKSARLLGTDVVEVAVKNDDYRECTIATQLLLRLLCREYVK